MPKMTDPLSDAYPSIHIGNLSIEEILEEDAKLTTKDIYSLFNEDYENIITPE